MEIVPMPKDLEAPLPNSVAPSCTLGEAGLSLWDRMQREYEVEDAASVEILTQVCLAADRRAELAGSTSKQAGVGVPR
jgi:hypothetical protein